MALLISLAIKATEVYVCKYENNGENYVCSLIRDESKENDEEYEVKEEKDKSDSFTFEWPDLNF